jgi:hypothetical protein
MCTKPATTAAIALLSTANAINSGRTAENAEKWADALLKRQKAEV